MPDSLRHGLWDVSRLIFFTDIGSERGYSRRAAPSVAFDQLTTAIQFRLLRISLDDLEASPSGRLSRLKATFYAFPFNLVYDFVEFLVDYHKDQSEVGEYINLVNRVLERERSQFRIAGSVFVRVTDEQELKEISKAQDREGPIAQHIRRAAQLFSNEIPDYRNSIKESISAVEAAVRLISGTKLDGIGKPLRKIDGLRLHPALIDGFNKLYGYTSDEQGIRHSLMDKSNLNQEDARYMLVSCSAFANYLIALKQRVDG